MTPVTGALLGAKLTQSEEPDESAEFLAQALRRYCVQYGISESRILALAGFDCVSIGQIGRLPSKELGARQRRTDALGLELRLNSAAAWAERIDRSSGVEALFDAQLRFLAISDEGRTLRPPTGPTNVMPRQAFLGHPYPAVLPGTVSECGGFVFGVSRDDWGSLLTGRIAGLQLEIEINFPFHYLQGIIEFWPVKTTDQGALLHSIIHRQSPARPSGRAHGVYIQRIAFA